MATGEKAQRGGVFPVAVAAAVGAGVVGGGLLAMWFTSRRSAAVAATAEKPEPVKAQPAAAAQMPKDPAARQEAGVVSAAAIEEAIAAAEATLQGLDIDWNVDAEQQQCDSVAELLETLSAARERAGATGANGALNRLPSLLQKWRAGISDPKWAAARASLLEDTSGELTRLLLADEEERRDILREVTSGRQVPELSSAAMALAKVVEGADGAKSGCCGGGGCGSGGGKCSSGGGGGGKCGSGGCGSGGGGGCASGGGKCGSGGGGCGGGGCGGKKKGTVNLRELVAGCKNDEERAQLKSWLVEEEVQAMLADNKYMQSVPDTYRSAIRRSVEDAIQKAISDLAKSGVTISPDAPAQGSCAPGGCQSCPNKGGCPSGSTEPASVVEVGQDGAVKLSVSD